jgi:hypothetical protein
VRERAGLQVAELRSGHRGLRAQRRRDDRLVTPISSRTRRGFPPPSASPRGWR